jgi:hypothetical protein
MLSRIFRPKKDEMVRGWKKLHSEELHNFCSSPNIIRMNKSRRMEQEGHVARMKEKMHIGFWWECQK